jgi:23S rRNA pseudouridine1911/1915/1917 synthase
MKKNISLPRKKTSEKSIDWKSQILVFHKDYLVVNKPDGILSQKDKSGAPDLADLLKTNISSLKDSFLAPVHRLDRNTSGLILLARSSAIAAKFSAALQEKEVIRTYLAIVKGDPGDGSVIDLPLFKLESENISKVDAKRGSRAITHFKKFKSLPSTSIVEVTLETGRSHQIRAHFSHLGFPLLGDKKYGKKPWSEIFHRPALHACRLKFFSPGERRWIEVEAPLPKDIQDLLVLLGG